MTALARIGLIAIAVLSAGLLAVGCGGSDETGVASAGGSPLSKSQFVAKAERICAASVQKIVKAGRRLFQGRGFEGESTIEAERRLVGSLLIPTLQAEIEKIRELPPPPGDEAEIKAFLAAMEEALSEAEEEPDTYVTSSDDYRAGAVHYGKANRIAHSYGLTGCPQG